MVPDPLLPPELPELLVAEAAPEPEAELVLLLLEPHAATATDDAATAASAAMRRGFTVVSFA